MEITIERTTERCNGLRSTTLRATCIGMLLCLILVSPIADAQTTCVGPVTGVPGNATREPHWWDATGIGVYYQSLDDPRWVGSASITFGDGTAENVALRALQDGTYLYLSWRTTHPLALNATDNKLWVGLQPSGGGNPVIATISLANETPASDQPSGDLAIQVNPLTGDVLGASPATAPWDQLNVWINQVKPSSPPDTVATAPNTWAVQMRVPLANLAVTASTFSMWFEVSDGTPESQGNPQNPAISIATWPRSNAFVFSDNAFVNHFPAVGTWNTFSYAAGCTAPGVSLSAMQIGVENNSPNSLIKYSQVPPAASHYVNTFFARPQNNSGTDLGAGSIKATFRIANWGSMANPSDWEVGVNIDDLWAKIQCFANDNPGTTPTDCGTNVPNKATILNGTLATTANESTFDWALSNAQLLPWVNGTRTVDNCLLVQLSSAAGPGVTFSNDSIRRNMDFVPASSFTRKAQINIKGLHPIAADGRDVYLWVETLNMPKISSGDNQPTQIGTTIPPQPQPTGGGNEPGRRPTADQAVPVGTQPGSPIPIPDANTLQQMAAEGKVTQSQLDAALPTYRVHVYWDTGKFMTVGGKQRPILNPQGAFGYYVNHQGQLYGWDHSLTGDGVALEQVAPDFYRIRKVPNNGVVTVVTTITALEHAPTRWWLWIILLLLLLLIVIWLLFRKKK